MSVLEQRPGPSSGHDAPSPAALMSQDAASEKKGPSLSDSTGSGLEAHGDARALVRLVQCRLCSRPFRSPVTLPCGNSVCRECLPEAHGREGIVAWPDLALRRHAIRCPFEECAKEHPVADYSLDVVMSKVMESITQEVEKHKALLANNNNNDNQVSTTIEEAPRWDEMMVESSSEKVRSYDMPGGRLLSTFTLAAEGKLAYKSDLNYHNTSEQEEAIRRLDEALLRDLVETTHRELDCQVCYRLMLEPITTVCGHSICRSCMARVLDHSQYCPICRRSVSIARSIDRHATNKTLTNLLAALCPETIAARTEALRTEAHEGELTVPLFICTLAFPHQPTFLRIFEPRYRLMLRRCLEANGEFGMLMYNQYREPQGDLGPVEFFHYGTMLRIVQAQTLPDGTSIIETQGAYRIRVLAHGEVDGYVVGKVERVDDVSPAEEERIEAEEMARSQLSTAADAAAETSAVANEPSDGEISMDEPADTPSTTTTSTIAESPDDSPMVISEDHAPPPPPPPQNDPPTSSSTTTTTAQNSPPSEAQTTPPATSSEASTTAQTPPDSSSSSSTASLPDDQQAQIDSLSTEDLFQRARDFIGRMQRTSAPWLQQRMLSVHGQPPEDAAIFPYWFASVLPIAEEEKYKLLATRSVRERLKITAGWIGRIEGQRWLQSNSACRIL